MLCCAVLRASVCKRACVCLLQCVVYFCVYIPVPVENELGETDVSCTHTNTHENGAHTHTSMSSSLFQISRRNPCTTRGVLTHARALAHTAHPRAVRVVAREHESALPMVLAAAYRRTGPVDKHCNLQLRGPTLGEMISPVKNSGRAIQPCT